jgi:4-amino-4-deoxy-L-arabinose transferase-like glycosyltransferase
MRFAAARLRARIADVGAAVSGRLRDDGGGVPCKIIAAILFFAAVFARVWRFPEYPLGFNQDGAMGAYDAYALLLTGADRHGVWLPTHLTAWGYGQMSPLLTWLTVPFVAVLGLTRLAARLPMLLVSLASLWVAFRFSLRLWGRHAALCVLFMLAVNPWHIMQSRWALDCNLLPHFLLFACYALYRALEKGFSRPWFYGSMTLFALCLYSYGIALYAVSLLLAGLCVYALTTKQVPGKHAALGALAFFAVCWPVYAMALINHFGWPSLETPFFTVPYFPDSRRVNDILFFTANPGAQLTANLRSLWRILSIGEDGLPWNAIPGFGSMYRWVWLLYAPGMWALWSSKETPLSERDGAKRRGLRIALWLGWLMAALLTGAVFSHVNINRINILFYPLIVLAGLGLYWAGKRSKAALAVFCAGILVMFSLFMNQYFTDHGDRLGQQFFHGFGEAIQYADAAGTAHVVNGIDRFWDTKEILTAFHLSLHPAYVRSGAFRERYRSVWPHQLIPDPAQNAAYIVELWSGIFFDPYAYDTFDFGNYRVAVPRR